ncbi:hypothetical protein [Boudabousia liubingyangii]|uniref:hypothetical protein n=1 Tax=Boudabousia liubingyangii TaxID=1921764 RepID=UPI000AD87381|nr:hypothetical protein [Boudabousia liubingyangii]
MYSWFFRKVLPGPTWLRIIESLFLIYMITLVLFLWVYPWVNDYFKLQGNTVG